ncbi:MULTISPECIES: Stk1 family PASTA domain-containing Ser/Thr kinase [unclassified Anaerostipes]|jgi:serine/threonine protein kinase|uniref:Stk1 family PASTA domain-containing Ser/Thr kinase n=1 Tax=unclassified Anaerostipes TaxID=2635253 RepID=UPI001BAE477D|nr:Stk1 family PASTA domain-containing Ser/Thr kinase [Anaerostipes sp. Marseille-Q3525]MBR9961643.1 Stk1 family PASTA domain-containing Ser/Thr kinase [Anaerostipes sp. Marseille-Q3525]
MLELGTMLSGRYEVLKRVGSGGMADVYMAKDHKLNRNVAVKVLKSEYVEDEKFLKKFETEAQAVARLSHPNIVNIYDVGMEDGINYIVMELAEGITLKEYIRKKGYLSPKETVEISTQIASAISHAHKNHIIHRDIKPQNILVSDTGIIKVTDFGIAKATSSNTVTSTATAMGSVHYISPEQAKGRFCDEKSDIYSLGITMYEMVTGHVPFDHENGVTIALMHLQNEITPPSQIRDGIPDSLEKIILKCTMKKPEERYQTADDLIADLRLVFEDTSGGYVGVVPAIDDSPTIMIDQNELTQRINTPKKDQKIQQEEPLKDEEQNAYLDEDDEEESGMNSKIEKLVIVLAAVVGAIILISIIVFVVKSSGVFKSGKSTTTTSIGTTAESNDTESKKYTVDNYIGMSLSAAREKIDGKFKIKVEEEYSADYAKGLVIRQDPESDTELEEGKTLTLVVSKGTRTEDKVSVPGVVGKRESSAKSELEAAGLKVSVKTKYSTDVAKGKVISQSPGSGNQVTKNSTVVITVSQGEKPETMVRVPNLRYFTESEARSELKNSNLVLGSVLTEYSDSVEKGLVIRQTVSSGSKVKEGTAVGIYVSLGPRQTATTADQDSTADEE